MVAGVCIHKEQWLDFGYASNDPANGDESAQVNTLHIPYGHRDVGEKWFKVQIAEQHHEDIQLRAKRFDLLSPKKMDGKAALRSVKMLVTLPTLVHDDIDDFILFANVFRRLW